MNSADARNRPWWRSPWLWAAGLLVVALVAAWTWRGRAIVVDALAMQPRELQRSLQFSARVQSRVRVDIGSTLTGRVFKVSVRAGDRVAAGASLIEIEADEWRAALAQAEAGLRQAQARADSQRAVANPGAQAALAQAEATLAAAERELGRTQSMLDANFVSEARLDDVRRSVQIARAQRDAAQAQAQANLANGSEADAARAQLDSARAALTSAQARLAQATLRAPAAGQVIARQVEPGQIVQPGRALLVMTIDGPTELVALVDERFLGQLRIGQSARVVADAYPGQPFDARLLRLAPAVDPLRGAVEVTFGADEAPDFLREDMTLSVEAVTGERGSSLVLPLSALRSNAGDRAVVGIEVEGRLQTREVQVGLRTLDQVEVTRGLEAGDVVLLDPLVAAGQRLRPRLLDPNHALQRGGHGSSIEGFSSAMGAGGSR